MRINYSTVDRKAMQDLVKMTIAEFALDGSDVWWPPYYSWLLSEATGFTLTQPKACPVV